MKKIFSVLLLSVLMLNCKNVDKKEDFNAKSETRVLNIKENQNVKLSRDINALKRYSQNHKVSSLSFQLNDSLKKYDLKYLFEEDTMDLKIKDDIAKIFLLKLLKYQLQNANQTYDLYEEIHGVRKDKSRVIPLYYLKRNNIDTIGEFLSTGMIMEEENKKNSPYIKSLINEVNKEYKRIDTLFNKSKK